MARLAAKDGRREEFVEGRRQIHFPFTISHFSIGKTDTARSRKPPRATRQRALNLVPGTLFLAEFLRSMFWRLLKPKHKYQV
jgi:hypothetical protein